MMAERNHFKAKIMLFGEYTVICGSMALIVPFDRFSGKWVFGEPGLDDALSLRPFNDYLSRHQVLGEVIDCAHFGKDIDEGLHFESAIPQGYGAGSSGALVAAVYHRYGKQGVANNLQLKNTLAAMESFFHGQSSGLDPLCSYLDAAVLVQSDGTPETHVLAPQFDRMGISLLLVDTKTTGKTGPLVGFFKEQLKQLRFFRMLNEQVIPLTNQSIAACLDNDPASLMDGLNKIADFQFNHLQPMIPDSCRSLWQHGRETGRFTLKLCGSGGGGYLLCFTQRAERTAQEIAAAGFEVISVGN
ncbi:MAG: mevalonate kinase [Bacteroidetes bacterium]|nr:mevalonate kinase [Bacteroidota bacterium]